MKAIATFLTFLLLLGCAGEPVISDIGSDKVRVLGNNAKPEEILAKANEGCGLYKKRATPLSFLCADQYCMQKHYLFACRE